MDPPSTLDNVPVAFTVKNSSLAKRPCQQHGTCAVVADLGFDRFEDYNRNEQERFEGGGHKNGGSGKAINREVGTVSCESKQL